MHPKYRNPGDRFRSGPPFGRNRSRGGGSFNRSYWKTYNPPRKFDILMEAGRLAAEYLVAKGVLPTNLVPSGGTLANGRVPEFRGQGRENPSQPPPFSEGRTWLGDSSVPDSSYGRRRFNDDYDSRKSGRGRKRMGFHSRDYDSDLDRERKRNGQWTERSGGGGYSDSIEDEENSPPGYRRDRRARYDKLRSSVSRVAGDEPQSKIEATGESGSELDDAGSKVSSSSKRKELQPEEDAEINKGMDDVTVSNLEAGEVNSGECDEVEKKVSLEEDMDVKPGRVKDESVCILRNNLPELSGFAKVPRRPRSSQSNKKMVVDQGPGTEASNKVEATSRNDSKMMVNESADGPSEDLHIVEVDNSEHDAPASSDVIKTNEEKLDSQIEVQQRIHCLESSTVSVNDPRADNSAEISPMEECGMEIKPSPSGTLQINDFSQIDSVRATQSSLLVDMPSQDEEMMEAVGQLKPVDSTPIDKVDADSFMGMEEEKQNHPASFKICDLNLMEAPEITEIPDDPALGNCRVTAPPLEGDGKVIPIIDLEDDSLEVNNSDTASKSKTEMMYPELENVLNHTSHTDDIPVFAISDYLGADISCSPSAQADLNNLQAGMTLNGAEGFPGVDDAIYGSLGDIGFMEVWDQPAHDYEKFF